MALEKKDLDAFIKEYTAIDARYLTDDAFSSAFSEVSPSIIEIIKPDLGKSYQVKGLSSTNRDNFETTLTCSKLMQLLDEKHRIALLTQCFAPTEKTKENASKKALLVSNMLENLLKNEDWKATAGSKLLKDIAYEIYWAISPTKGKHNPYFNFADLQANLKGIADNIDKDKYSDTLEELRKIIKMALTPLTPESDMVLTMGPALMENPAPVVKHAPVPKDEAKGVEQAPGVEQTLKTMGTAFLPPTQAPKKTKTESLTDKHTVTEAKK